MAGELLEDRVMPDVVCLGQFTADVVVRPVESYPEEGKAVFVDDISLQNGGSACNTAVVLSKLGVDTAVMGKVGTDTFGEYLIELLTGLGLNTSAMVRDPGINTSSTVVLISPSKERSFLHFSGANTRMSEADVDFNLIKTAKILHIAAAFLVPGLDGEPMARVLARAQQMGVTTSLDTSWDADGRWFGLLEPCLSHVDIFTPNIEEAQMLSGKTDPPEIADFLLACGVKTAVLKLGAEGCYARTADCELTVPAFDVPELVDTLGAGDAFTAGFLAATVADWDIEKACIFANAAGACCVGAIGSSGIIPMEEIARLYSIG